MWLHHMIVKLVWHAGLVQRGPEHDSAVTRALRAGRGVDRRRLAIAKDRLRRHTMVPSDQLAARVEAGLQMMRGHRAELAEGDVFLPAPDHLDRLADR